MPLGNSTVYERVAIVRQGKIVAYGLTPGYETYTGLGWYGCLMQTLPRTRTSPPAPRARIGANPECATL